MTFDEYQAKALRTASMGLGPELEMCIRALGLCGEVSEFMRARSLGMGRTIAEAGDVLWYAAALADSFGLREVDLGVTGDLTEFHGYYAYDVLPTLAGQLAEIVKKEIGHKKPGDRKRVADLLYKILRWLPVWAGNLDRIAAENLKKLEARYPNGFDLSIASTKADEPG